MSELRQQLEASVALLNTQSITQELSKEAEAAKALMANVRDVLAGDEDAIEDAIEGETNFKEACARAVARLAEIDALTDAIKAQRDSLDVRFKRLEQQGDNIRAALVAAMETAELAKLELAQATISRKAVAPKLTVTDEQAIPTHYFKRADPKLDRVALLSALKDKQIIPGAELSNGGETLAVRYR